MLNDCELGELGQVYDGDIGKQGRALLHEADEHDVQPAAHADGKAKMTQT